jgi:hypothetical protein
MAFDETIGKWTVTQLVRFLQEQLRQNPPTEAPDLTTSRLKCYELLDIKDQVQFNQVQTTVGAAGVAAALPATPSGYIRILDYTGQPFVIPYYKAS